MELKRHQLIGVMLTSMGTLTLEIVITRIFSVTMWYHFAFLAVSLALMGSATAGVALYFFPELFNPERAQRWIGIAAVSLAVAIPVTFILYLQIPFKVLLNTTEGFTLQQILWIIFIYLDLSIPFFLSGLINAMALTVWSKDAGRLYWADLTGAALGCLVSILILERLGGANGVLAISAIIAAAGVAFSTRPTLSSKRLKQAYTLSLVTLPLLIGFAIGNVKHEWITITTNKVGGEEAPRIYEKWNAHSRVTVYEPVDCPFFWAVSSRYWDKTIAQGGNFRQALLLIDAVAGTPIQGFDGILGNVAFLRYDLTSFAYHLIDQPNTFVIGPGGGRDILAALASGAPHVTAVEVNPAIVDAVRDPFADLAGHLYDRPDVTVEVADARGYIARSPERYDVIQASLIDTWAAGGSGAFALSENSLYTVEAFRTYYEHLTDRGILTVSRWYQPNRPAETLRLVSTAIAGWQLAGVEDPGQHVAVVSLPISSAATEELATALFKRSPFTSEEVTALQAKAEELDFAILYAPGLQPYDEVGEFITAKDQAAFIKGYPLDISPATDDRPFFFNLVLLGDLMDPALSRSGVYRTSMEAIFILGAVIAVSTTASLLFVVIPLGIGKRQGRRLAKPSGWLLGYFASLGLAFMLIEVPTIQKLTVYLGKPVYSLAIVLFSILLFSGVGSLVSSQWTEEILQKRLKIVFPALAVMILLHATTALWPLPQTLKLSFEFRLAMTMVLLAPLSFLMGMPFPSGIRWAGTHNSEVVPWLWGINGAMSVLGSALATALALHLGFKVTIMIAALLYLLAGILLRKEIQQTRLT